MKNLRPPFLPVFFCLALLPGTSSGSDASSPAVSVNHSVARDYGYFIGDLVEVSYQIFLPPDHYLNEESLPNGGGSTEGWLEIRGKKHERTATRGSRVDQLTFLYQVFSAAERAQPYEIPAIPFFYGPRGNPSAHSSALPPVPILISPLTAPEAQPLPPILRPWTSSTREVVRTAGIVLLLGSAVPLALQTRRRIRIHSPFGAAVKKIGRQEDPAAALILFRNALSEKAGKAIFPENLDDFFQVFPRGRVYERELREMVFLSEEVIFNPRNVVPVEGLATRVAAVLNHLRRAERWA